MSKVVWGVVLSCKVQKAFATYFFIHKRPRKERENVATYKTITFDDRKAIAALYEKGATTAEISESVGVPKKTLYGELKRGIKPEMYALSTLIFAVVLIVLLLVNYMPRIRQKQIQRKLQNRKAAS